MKRKILLVPLALLLAVSLVAIGCAPPAPAPAPAAPLEEKIAELEDEVAAAKAEIAALRKPAEVYRWEPSTWITAGSHWDFLVYLSDYLNEASDGRIVSTPAAPGAVCPVDETAQAVGAGLTQASTMGGYQSGIVPACGLANTATIGMRSWEDVYNCRHTFKDGLYFDILSEEIEKHFNVKVVREYICPSEYIISSRVDIPRIADLKGKKFRCGDDYIAGPLHALGATTVWAPGPEIYTMFATGVIDAVTYGNAYDHYSMSFHEVTKYWVSTPITVADLQQFIVNRDTWNEMPDDLKALVKAAVAAADHRQAVEAKFLIASAWKDAIDYGIIPIPWPEEDMKLWRELMLEWAFDFYKDDPSAAKMLEIIKEYCEFLGL